MIIFLDLSLPKMESREVRLVILRGGISPSHRESLLPPIDKNITNNRQGKRLTCLYQYIKSSAFLNILCLKNGFPPKYERETSDQ